MAASSELSSGVLFRWIVSKGGVVLFWWVGGLRCTGEMRGNGRPRSGNGGIVDVE